METTETISYIPTIDDELDLIEESKKFREEWKRKLSKSNKGVRRSEETKKRVSAAKIGVYLGKNNPFYGKHHSEKTKQQLREANLGKKQPKEVGLKISKSLKGKNTWTKGRKSSIETRKKISESNKGKTISEWQKERIREARATQLQRTSKLETEVRNELIRLRIQFRYDQTIKGALTYPYARHRFDIIIDSEKIIIEVQGCHFHVCKLCGRIAKYKDQLRNLERDQIIRATIRNSEWTLIELWEHDIKSDMTIEYLLRREIPQLFKKAI